MHTVIVPDKKLLHEVECSEIKTGGLKFPKKLTVQNASCQSKTLENIQNNTGIDWVNNYTC